ncbi:GNAT family N-acetyltransferase [Namhaeicola litoreus]|uniref:GNAT family N-acetyltransferase n=1 Tax=Namhaeicola litoreus TaxID=1052145 RepID=A0ABW3Y339_9FLAO
MINYFQELSNHYILRTPLKKHANSQAELQRIVFPTLSEEELMTAEQYKRHLEIFPEGQLIILDGEKVIASSTTMRQNYHEGHHTFLEISDNLWMGTHDPGGNWLYGLDVSVHPDYRGKGFGRAIYNARQEIAQNLGCKGQLTAGMPIGYDRFRKEMTIADYCDALIRGDLTDPTVTAQVKCGFTLVEPLFDYLDDPRSGNASILMYRPIDPQTKLK